VRLYFLAQLLFDTNTRLAYHHANGEGALQDLSKAKYWIKKAYEGGNARAKEALGAFEL
jgi:TPR repeat protein